MTMAANSKLNLTGDGTPLGGSGILDVTSNRSSSVEYTGRATFDVTQADPLKRGLDASHQDALGRFNAGLLNPSTIQIPSSVREFAPKDSISPLASGFSRVASLTLTKKKIIRGLR